MGKEQKNKHTSGNDKDSQSSESASLSQTGGDSENQVWTWKTYRNLEFKRNHQRTKHLTWKWPQSTHWLGTVSKIFTGGLKISLHPGNPHPHLNLCRNIYLFGPREGFLTHQWFNSRNKQITIKSGGIKDEHSTVKTFWNFGWTTQCHCNTGAKGNRQLNPDGPRRKFTTFKKATSFPE